QVAPSLLALSKVKVPASAKLPLLSVLAAQQVMSSPYETVLVQVTVSIGGGARATAAGAPRPSTAVSRTSASTSTDNGRRSPDRYDMANNTCSRPLLVPTPAGRVPPPHSR